jgi:hypothetical protein
VLVPFTKIGNTRGGRRAWFGFVVFVGYLVKWRKENRIDVVRDRFT